MFMLSPKCFLRDAVSDLASAGRKTYVSVVFKAEQHWDQIMNSPDSHPYLKDVETLEQFISDNKISGILFEALGLFVSHIL